MGSKPAVEKVDASKDTRILGLVKIDWVVIRSYEGSEMWSLLKKS